MEQTTPKKTPFQQVTEKFNEQSFSTLCKTQLPQKWLYQKTNQPLKRCQFWILTQRIDTTIKCQYDNSSFELLPLDLVIIAAFCLLPTNALLKGEQRNTEVAAYRLKH
ncbi:TPA: hypothetical protein ACVO0T_001064 [Vibrio alginolyticus]